MLPSSSAIASRLRFRQLTLLVALDEHGSLHRAAERTGMTQPGLTKALREIETTFGAELFTRDGGGTLVAQEQFEIVREAAIEDVGGLLDLISPLEEQGILVRRSREVLEREIEQLVDAKGGAL